MSIFRRHTMKGIGKINTSQLPDWFNEHVVCWYSPVLQGCTNESLTADPTLYDLSGKGCDAEIVGFKGAVSDSARTFGVQDDGSLWFISTSYAQCKKTFALTDFTIICDRDTIHSTNAHCVVAGKCDSNTNGAFRFEYYKGGIVTSYKSDTKVTHPYTRTISIMTPTEYNGVSITRGTSEDNTAYILTINAVRPGGGLTVANIRLWSFILFDITLTPEQIEWVKTNIITD